MSASTPTRSNRVWPFIATGVLAIAIYLFAKNIRRALDGEWDGVWMIIFFGLIMVFVAWGISKWWTLILDDRDALEVLTIAANQNHANLSHFHRNHPNPRNTITERGYSYTLRDGQTDIRISLIFLGKETPDKKTVIGEKALLTIAVRVPQPFNLAIVNPSVDIRESIDVEFYAPLVLESKRYAYQRHGIIFSNYPKEAIQSTFENPFLQTELIELFERCHFKFAVFDERRAIAVKSASVENLHRDVESFPVLMAISRLIASQQEKQHVSFH